MTLALLLASSLLTLIAAAQDLSDPPAGLSRDRFKSGAATLESFAPIAKQTRYSVVKLDIDGSTVALGAVIDAAGFALTKASEIRKGKLTCWLPGGKEVDAELIATDEENDVALVKVHADGLKPIEWSSEEIFVGQWAVTPGIESTPQAVGIVSVPPRKILNKREELTKTLRNFREGQSVRLRVRRDEQEMDAEVRMMAPNPERLGRGYDRSERMNRLGGGVSGRAEGFALAIQHDTVLQPWQCGGPLVNLAGKAIGLNIARAGRVASYALPAALVQQIRDSLHVSFGARRDHEPTPNPSQEGN